MAQALLVVIIFSESPWQGSLLRIELAKDISFAAELRSEEVADNNAMEFLLKLRTGTDASVLIFECVEKARHVEQMV